MRRHHYLPAMLGIILLGITGWWAQGAAPKGTSPQRPPTGQTAPPQGMPSGRPMMRNPFTMELTTLLKLSPAQATKVKAIQQNTRTTIQAHATAASTKQQAAEQALRADKPDMAKIKKLITAAGQEQIAIHLAMAQGFVNLQAVLTKDQRAKLPPLRLFPGRGMGLQMKTGGPGHGMPGGPPPMGEGPGGPPRGERGPGGR